ncbi:MAG: hypothetical protein E7463_10520 [Ruminococcaceae bacterium]|nr:hypothetical protein [Oscillospiraceae bacterium]
MKEYVFERFSDDSYRLINQAGVKEVFPVQEGNENFNACWDACISPDGKFYYTLSSESGKCDHAKMVHYDYDTNTLTECFYAGDVLLPQERQLPHSKLHTSMNFMNDGRMIATTHSTDRAKHHVEWMPFGHHNHVWEGFPGSQILVWDPKTGHLESWGTPVPHESIYGSKYDPKHDRLYMIGFMRGHVYSFDCRTRRVTKDLGKVAELYCYRLVLGADGNIYGCTKSGQLFCIDTEKNELVQMEFHVPEYPDNYVNNTWYRYMECARNHPSGRFMYFTNATAPYMHKLDFATGEVCPVGDLMPKDGIYELPAPDGSWNSHSFIIDKYGVIWYCMHHWSIHNNTGYTDPRPCYLLRWDLQNGEEPRCLGIIGTTERALNSITEMEYDEKRDILYLANVGHGFGSDGPAAMGIDLAQFRAHMNEPGPVAQDEFLRPRKLTEEELKAREERAKKKIGEEVTEHNPFQAFHPTKVTPVRIWRSVPRDRVAESGVIGMAWDDAGILHVVTGSTGKFDEASFVMRIKGGKVAARLDFDLIADTYREWLRTNIYPQAPTVPEGAKLPEATGRRYRAVASASAQWHDGRTFVGTRDALCALVSPEGKAYSLGNAAAYGPVRCVCTNADKTELWGVAGDDEDMGYVFHYDDETGLRQLGILNYNSHGFFDGPTAANVLSSVTLSGCGKFLAIGGADRIGTVHIIAL